MSSSADLRRQGCCRRKKTGIVRRIEDLEFVPRYRVRPAANGPASSMATRFRGLISRQDGQDSSRLFYCSRACFSRAPLHWALLRCLYLLICCVIQEPLLSLFCFSESSSMVRWTSYATTPPHCSRAWNRFQAIILSKSPRRVKASRTFKPLFFFQN